MRAPRQCCARDRILLVEFRFVDCCGYVDSASTQEKRYSIWLRPGALGLYALDGWHARGALRLDLVRAERRERAPGSSASHRVRARSADQARVVRPLPVAGHWRRARQQRSDEPVELRHLSAIRLTTRAVEAPGSQLRDDCVSMHA